MRQPDIEIYLKDASQDAITAWLSEALGSCSEWQQRGQTFQCRAGEIPVVFLPRAVGKWHSLMLESDATPWQDDIACAHAAFAVFGGRNAKVLFEHIAEVIGVGKADFRRDGIGFQVSRAQKLGCALHAHARQVGHEGLPRFALKHG